MAPLDRPTILIVDPDPTGAARLASLLSLRYTVEVAPDAASAHARLGETTRPPALVVLELELPDVDGLILCAGLRARTSAALLVHTTRDTRRDLVLSLRLGADDFVAKPADPAELEARIGALIRRAARSATPGAAPAATVRQSAGAQRVGDLVIDRERATATIGERRLALTQTEFRLLSAFARRLDEPLPRHELARVAGDDAYVAGTRALDMHVRRLRAKLHVAQETAAAPGTPGAFGAFGAHATPATRLPAIVPVRGVGYRMISPAAAPATRIAPPAA